MSGWDVHIHGARRRITQHIILEGLALDCDSADGTPRSEEPAHAATPLALPILQANDCAREDTNARRSGSFNFSRYTGTGTHITLVSADIVCTTSEQATHLLAEFYSVIGNSPFPTRAVQRCIAAYARHGRQDSETRRSSAGLTGKPLS